MVREFRAARLEEISAEDVLTRGRVRWAIGRLDWRSSPGYPYCLTFQDNGKLFNVRNGEPDPAAVETFVTIVLDQISERKTDPIRLFIKPEPHTQKKLSEGRYRLISSVSVVDQIIDHLLFGDQNDAMTENYMHLPSRVGWSPYLGGWRWVPQGDVVAIDKSSWDWTVTPWLLQAAMEVRIALRSGPSEDTSWSDLVRWRYKSLFGQPLFVTSGGHLLRQKEPGVMKSGCVNTITDNSIMQVILHTWVCMRLNIAPGKLWAMGDDTLQEKPRDIYAYLRELSRYCIVKQALAKAEFCGHEFKGDVVDPVYFGKHCFNLLHLNDSVAADITRSYSLLYHRSPKRQLIRAVVGELREEFPSSATLDCIFDGW